jgi:fructose-1,6-bisphosphatase-3
VVKRVEKRKLVGDTDVGMILKENIADLEKLLEAYRTGALAERIRKK